MAQPRGRFPVRTQTKRRTGWDFGPGGTSILSISATGPGFLGSVAQSLVDGLTVVRTRGRFMMYLDAATSAHNGFVGAFGIGITTLQAITIGITAVPVPLTDADWDGWLFHQFIQCVSPVVIGAGITAGDARSAAPTATVAFDVDSKAMRKMDEDMVLFAAFDLAETGASGARLMFDSRILLKLP